MSWQSKSLAKVAKWVSLCALSFVLTLIEGSVQSYNDASAFCHNLHHHQLNSLLNSLHFTETKAHLFLRKKENDENTFLWVLPPCVTHVRPSVGFKSIPLTKVHVLDVQSAGSHTTENHRVTRASIHPCLSKELAEIPQSPPLHTHRHHSMGWQMIKVSC